MTKKLIDIDEDTLAQATEILGAATMKGGGQPCAG